MKELGLESPYVLVRNRRKIIRSSAATGITSTASVRARVIIAPQSDGPTSAIACFTIRPSATCWGFFCAQKKIVL